MPAKTASAGGFEDSSRQDPSPPAGADDWYKAARKRLNGLAMPNTTEERNQWTRAHQILKSLSETLDISAPKIWLDTLPPNAVHICFWNGPDKSLEFYVFPDFVQAVKWQAMSTPVVHDHYGATVNFARDMMAWLYPEKNGWSVEDMMQLLEITSK